MRLKISSDAIQFVTMLIFGLGLLGGFWGYCEAHFAKADEVNSLSQEVHALYLKLIPEGERASNSR
jgi:hypothetical protein